MRKDRDYIALCQIERGMQNEISTFSLANTRLIEYIQSMSSSTTQINGTLKAMKCLARIDQKQKNQRSADCVLAWMNALIQAKQKPILAMLFRSVDFTMPIQEEFKQVENRQTMRIAKERSRMAWFVILGLALLFGAWMAVSVFILHANFFWMLILCLILYALFLTYYFLWWDRKHYIYRLKQLTEHMSPDSKRFVRSLDVQNLYWRPDGHTIQQMIKVSIYPERLERYKKQAHDDMPQTDLTNEVILKADQNQEKSKPKTKGVEKTQQLKPIVKEKIDFEAVPSVPQKAKSERKAAPNRKKAGHAARPIIRLSDQDSIHVSDLDCEDTHQVRHANRNANKEYSGQGESQEGHY